MCPPRPCWSGGPRPAPGSTRSCATARTWILIWRMIAGGWRVRYDPAAEVRHAEPGRWRRVLARRFRYGRSAAPLARRHPGPGAAAGPAGVAGRRGDRPAGPAAHHRAGRLRRRHRPAGLAAARLGHRRPGRARADGRVRAAHLARRRPVERPVRAPGRRGRPRLARRAARPRRGPRQPGRRLALAALLAGAPAAAWLRGRPRLDPVRFTLAYLADEAAYGAGVYRGALDERLADPLLPRLAWRPPAAPGVTKHVSWPPWSNLTGPPRHDLEMTRLSTADPVWQGKWRAAPLPLRA